MIHSLEDKTKKELVEICILQIEEYQILTKRIAELEYRVAELVIRRDVQKQDFDERIAELGGNTPLITLDDRQLVYLTVDDLERVKLEQQAKGVKDFFASVEPKISMGESKLWELQTHNVNCYLDNLRNQAKGGAE